MVENGDAELHRATVGVNRLDRPSRRIDPHASPVEE